jgi:hypothetical protein
MSDFNVRSDSVDVEQIMQQIRARIREKRGVDYTEQQIKELAAVKLEKFLDPRGVRSDLLDRFKRREPLALEPAVLPTYAFEEETIYETHRGLLRFIRRLLNPLLKLLFNPNAIIRTLHQQADINRLTAERDHTRDEQRRDVDTLYYEVVHNLVVEMTKSALEVKNLKMRVESLASRLEFSERRARALESVVAYKPKVNEEADLRTERLVEPSAEQRGREPRADVPRAMTPGTSSLAAPPAAATPSEGSAGAPVEGPGQRSRRRRRRRGRRSNVPASAIMGASTDRQDSVDSDSGHTETESSADESRAVDLSSPADAAPGSAGHRSADSDADPDSQ